MSKPSKTKPAHNALVVLSSARLEAGFKFDQALMSEAVRREMALIKKAESHTALRGLRLGLVLHCVKATLAHGKFMPWVKKAFSDSHRTATDYMRLARFFVEKTRIQTPDVLALSDTKVELSLDEADGKVLFAKAVKFIGDKTLSELIAEAAQAHGTAPGKTKATTLDEEQLYLFARDEIGSFLTRGEELLVKENRLQYLAKHPEEIRGVVESLRTLADRVEKAAKPILST